jgi:hypothetical protein
LPRLRGRATGCGLYGFAGFGAGLPLEIGQGRRIDLCGFTLSENIRPEVLLGDRAPGGVWALKRNATFGGLQARSQRRAQFARRTIHTGAPSIL